MNDTQKNLTAGDIVFARPIVEGKTLGRRKGIVLGDWTERDAKRVVVWFYGMGPAIGGENCHLMYRDELDKSGDIFDLSARLSFKLYDTIGWYERGRAVKGLLGRHAGRMKSLGARQPVK